MRCPKCKQELPEQARFCLYCGAPVEPSAEDGAQAEGGADGEAPAVEPSAEKTDELRGLDIVPDENGVAPAAIEESPRIPAAKKLEEPLSPLVAGAVPMISSVPPRASWASQRAPRPYTTPSERMASRASANYQPRTEDYVLPDGEFADEPQVEDTVADASADKTLGSMFGRARRRASSDLAELGDRMKAEADAVEKPRRRIMAVFAVVVVAIVAVFLVRVGASWLGPWSEVVDPTPQVEPPSDDAGSIDPVDLDDDSSSSEAEEDPAATLPEGAPEVRSSVDEYSWTELSQIAALIAEAATDREGVEVAATYNLCAEDGSLNGLEVKDLELADGTTIGMRIAGFRQDVAAGGEEPVGISFVAEDSVGAVAWDEYARTNVGWEGSTLREWLNDSLLASLPEELQGAIAEVTKVTNQPAASGAAGQQTTSDKLWVPSFSELVGGLSLGSPRYGSYTSEGEQYQLFEALGVSWEDASAAALASGYWWTRSPDVANGNWVLCVSPDGIPSYGNRPATQNEILIGFCL